MEGTGLWLALETPLAQCAERTGQDTRVDLDALTFDGHEDRRQGSVLLLACGALAREILDLKRLNGWDHMDLACLPAILHNHPEKIVPAVRQAVAAIEGYESIFLAYADCGTGGELQKAADELGLRRDNVSQLAKRARLDLRRCLEKKGYQSVQDVLDADPILE